MPLERIPFPDIKIVDFKAIVCRLGHFLLDQVHYEHPLDNPIQSVTDWPGQPTHEHLCVVGKDDGQPEAK